MSKRILSRLYLKEGFFLLLLLSSPAVAWAAAEEEHKGWGVLDEVGKVLNLLLLIAILVYFLRKPLAHFLSNRTEDIKRRLAEAQRARDEATAKLAEIEKKMLGLDEELRQIKATAQQEAAAERARILKEAQADAERITLSARREIDGLVKSARAELKAYTAELSVRLAENTIRREITPEDEQRIFERFIGNFKTNSGTEPKQ